MYAVNNLLVCSTFFQNRCDNQFSNLHFYFILSPYTTYRVLFFFFLLLNKGSDTVDQVLNLGYDTYTYIFFVISSVQKCLYRGGIKNGSRNP